MKKSFVLILAALLNLNLLFCDEVLDYLNTSWSIVLPGKVISEPVVTSYGFSVLTDAKLLQTYSNSGKLLWEQTVNKYRDSKLYVMPDDFLLLISDDNKRITLLNPSGVELWTRSLSFQITNPPAFGWDGRFFLNGTSTIECFGITGLTKWKKDFSAIAKIPFQTLPDGSLVAFLEQTNNGKTVGLRFSPFGEVIEEITFAGQIISAATNDEGIFLTFSDGTAGYFSLVDNKSQNKWVLQNSGNKPADANQIKNSRFIICEDTTEVFYVLPTSSSVSFYKIQPQDGQIVSSFVAKNIRGHELNSLIFKKNGIFLCDNTNAAFYNLDGLEQWYAKIPPKTGRAEWNYMIYTNDNSLNFCGTNWTMNSYRVSQTTKNVQTFRKTRNYNNWYTIDTSEFEYVFQTTIEGEFCTDKRYSQLQKGNYGTEEIDYISELMSACEVYKSALMSNANRTNKEGHSLFDLDTIGTQHIVNQTTMYSSSTFTNYEAFYLQRITNKSILLSLLDGISNFGYDPNGKVLEALEVLARKTNYKEEALLNAICDATYSICRFMGRPAFNTKGKEILQNFLNPNYSSNTRIYTRETLKKIASLNL